MRIYRITEDVSLYCRFRMFNPQKHSVARAQTHLHDTIQHITHSHTHVTQTSLIKKWTFLSLHDLYTHSYVSFTQSHSCQWTCKNTTLQTSEPKHHSYWTAQRHHGNVMRVINAEHTVRFSFTGHGFIWSAEDVVSTWQTEMINHIETNRTH